MPFGPADVVKHNPLIKTDRHMQMWLDLVNSAVKRGRPEQVAIDEANSAVNMDMARSRVMSNPGTLLRDESGFDPRNPPKPSGSKQERMTIDQALHDTRVDADKVNIPYGQLPGDEQRYQDYKVQQERNEPRPADPASSNELPFAIPPPTPAESVNERFPYSEQELGAYTPEVDKRRIRDKVKKGD